MPSLLESPLCSWVFRGGRFCDGDGARMGFERPFGPETHQQVHYDTVAVASRHPRGAYIVFGYVQPTVVICDRREGLLQGPHAPAGRTKSFSVLGKICEGMIGEAIGTATGKGWGDHNRAFKPTFGRASAAARHHLIASEAALWAGRLEGRTAMPIRSGDTRIDRLTLRTMAKVLYGDDVMTAAAMEELSAIASMHEQLMSHLGAWQTRCPVVRDLPTALNARMVELKARWAAFHGGMVRAVLVDDPAAVQLLPPGDAASVRAVGDGPGGNGSVLWELATMAADAKMRLSHAQVLDNFDELLLLNLDVMYGTLGHLFYDLATHPAEQEKVWAELAEYGDDYLRAGSGVSLPILDCFVWESARLHPQVVLSLPETLPTDRWLGGYFIPAGTVISVDGATLNRDPSVFGPDPDAFRPERFAKDCNLVHEVHRFGFGPRKCLGQNYADAIIRCVLCNVLLRYRLAFDSAEAAPGVGLRTKGFVYFQQATQFPEPSLVPR